MKILIKLSNAIMVFASKKALVKKLGKENYQVFLQSVKRYQYRFYPLFPKLGKSVFSNSYFFGSCYFLYYPAFKDLGYSVKEAGELIWIMNEAFMLMLPSFLRGLTGKYYAGYFRKLGPWATKQAQENKLHPDDWRISFSAESKSKFAINIYECYIVKLANRLELPDILPTICRMDHLFSHYFHQGFRRTKTLGDGDSLCNCEWTIPGECEWPITEPEQK